MAATCPYCRETDLPEGAVKCRACGSWLDPTREADDAETFRRDLRADVQADLKGHRESLIGMLTQLKWVAAIIVTSGLGAALFFGFRTDQSISDTADRISREAEVQIRTASTDIADQTRARMATAIAERIAAPETTAMIEETMRAALTEKVAAEVARRSEEISVQVSGQIATAQAELAAVFGEIDAMEARSKAALARLGGIETAFDAARAQTVEGSQSVLPVEGVQIEGKGDVGALWGLMQARVDALGFQMGNFYYGPVVWKYFDRLRTLPEFRFVVITGGAGEYVGFFDAATVAAVFDPPDSADLTLAFGTGDGIPDEAQVPGWTAFARAVSDGDLASLAAVEGFLGLEGAVRSNWTSLQALDHMDRIRRDVLPVVGPDGMFQGVLDRSRLTSRVLLDLAGGAP